MDNEEQGRLLSAVVARAMSDEAFRASLIADAATVLAAEGISIPEGATLNVLQASPTQLFLVLPDPQSIDDELLASSAGGSTVGSAGTVGSVGTASLTSTFIGTLGSVGSAGTAGSA